jgi:hypothetical protein
MKWMVGIEKHMARQCRARKGLMSLVISGRADRCICIDSLYLSIRSILHVYSY